MARGVIFQTFSGQIYRTLSKKIFGNLVLDYVKITGVLGGEEK